MKLYTESCYNPFFIDIGSKSFEIDNIYFFDAEGVICSTGRGWFGNNNNFRAGLVLPVDCIVRRKEDYKSKCAFLLSSGVKSWATNKTSYKLYIPADIVALQAPVITDSFQNKRCYIIEWKTNIPGIFVSHYHHADQALSLIESQINEIGEKIHHLYTDHFADFPNLLNQLQKLEKARQKEWYALTQITPETILKEYHREAKR